MVDILNYRTVGAPERTSTLNCCSHEFCPAVLQNYPLVMQNCGALVDFLEGRFLCNHEYLVHVLSSILLRSYRKQLSQPQYRLAC